MPLKIIFAFSLLIFLVIPSHSATNTIHPLAEKTIEDLKEIHKILLEKSYLTNPAYEQWLNTGFEKSLEMAKKVNSHGGYTAVLSFYLAGFKKDHLQIRFLSKNSPAEWPGFLVGKINKNYEVISSNSKLKTDTPPLGAKLINCDGKSPQELLQLNVYPFYAIAYESDSELFTPLIFLDRQNPWFYRPKKCLFHIERQYKEYTLSWFPETFDRGQFRGKPLMDYLYEKSNDFDVSEFGKNTLWVSIPTFMPPIDSEAYKKSPYAQMIAKQNGWDNPEAVNKKVRIDKALQNLKNKKIIVLDVRGNTGGTLLEGWRLLENIYGEQYSSNIFNEIPVPLSSVKAKVFVLTDNRCASACWAFVGWAKKFNIIHVGRPTHSFDMCGDPYGVPLPSGFAQLIIPSSCNDEETLRLTKEGKPFIPTYFFDGDIRDTQNIQKWLLSLLPHIPSPQPVRYKIIKQ